MAVRFERGALKRSLVLDDSSVRLAGLRITLKTMGDRTAHLDAQTRLGLEGDLQLGVDLGHLPSCRHGEARQTKLKEADSPRCGP